MKRLEVSVAVRPL